MLVHYAQEFNHWTFSYKQGTTITVRLSDPFLLLQSTSPYLFFLDQKGDEMPLKHQPINSVMKNHNVRKARK